MKVLLIINSAPYGNEHAYNALRIAMQFQKDYDGDEIRVFLMADGALCALSSQQTPNGYYNIERMLDLIMKKGAKVNMCTSCGEARGLKDVKIIEGVEWSSMKDLTFWIADSDKVINY